MTTVTKKHPQFILASMQAFYDDKPRGVQYWNVSKWLEEVQSELAIRERFVLEKDAAYRQLLPYVVVTQEGDDGLLRYLPYKRTKQVGEERLFDKVSIGYGGHIDLAEVRFDVDSVLLLKDTILACVRNEMGQELQVAGDTAKTWLHHSPATFSGHFIVSDEGVDRYHLAIIMHINVPKGLVFECAEAELEMMTPMTGQELLASNFPIESWSRLYLEHLERSYEADVVA